MNYSQIAHIDLNMLRSGVTALDDAMDKASNLRVARENLVENFLSNLVSRASVTFTEFTQRWWPSIVKSNFVRLGDTPRNSEKVEFVTIKDLQLHAMEGFEGKYIDYGPVVFESMDYFEKVLDDQLRQYKLFLARLISNSQEQLSLKTLEGIDKNAATVLQDMETKMAVFWKEGSFKSIITVSDVVDRSSDFVEIFDTAKKIHTRNKSVDMQNIIGRVNEVKALIDIVNENIANKGFDKINNQQLKNIAHGVLSLAKSVEFYGITLYRVNIYLAAVERLRAIVARVA